MFSKTLMMIPQSKITIDLATKSLFLTKNISRTFITSSKVLNSSEKYGEYEGEYHRTSTRYRKCDRDTLTRLEGIKFPHHEPENFGDKVALTTVRFLRKVSDIYFKRRFILRATMLETIAAVPGMVAGMTHHTRSLRLLQHCRWIKPTMDEAENERMHLLTFMDILQPSKLQRMVILGVQGVFFSSFTLAYILAPRVCHRFVGYLEEEACHTYSEMIKDVDAGVLPNVPAPKVAVEYWGLPQDAKLRDVLLVIRADEADHRLVNHHLSDLQNRDVKRACEVIEIDLEAPFQTEEEQTIAGGPYQKLYKERCNISGHSHAH